ncbi:hypothetical protein [Hydrogenophaga sp.]
MPAWTRPWCRALRFERRSLCSF